jgi:hypothetical protein
LAGGAPEHPLNDATPSQVASVLPAFTRPFQPP